MNCIRPVIAYLVSKLSRFTSNSSINHWKVIKKKGSQISKVYCGLWVTLYWLPNNFRKT